jgi:hypothetical protein
LNLYQQVVTVMFLVASLVTALYLCGQFIKLARYGYPQPWQTSLGYRILFPINFGVIGIGLVKGAELALSRSAMWPWYTCMLLFAVHIMLGNWVVEDLGSGNSRTRFEGWIWTAGANHRSVHQEARSMVALWLITGLVAVIVLISLK